MPNQNAINNIQISDINVQTFTTSGTYTPTAGMKYCIITLIGGGGGGGGVPTTNATECAGAGGGGSGGFATVLYTAAQVGASRTVTIGTGGASGIALSGSNGTSSIVTGLLTCDFGEGGSVGTLNTGLGGFANPGEGGDVTIAGGGIALLSFKGQTGSFGTAAGANTFSGAGQGGSNPYGACAFEYSNSGQTYTVPSGVGYGAGGGGSKNVHNDTERAGSSGLDGYCSIIEFIV